MRHTCLFSMATLQANLTTRPGSWHVVAPNWATQRTQKNTFASTICTTFATWLRQAGVGSENRKVLLGHTVDGDLDVYRRRRRDSFQDVHVSARGIAWAGDQLRPTGRYTGKALEIAALVSLLCNTGVLRKSRRFG